MQEWLSVLWEITKNNSLYLRIEDVDQNGTVSEESYSPSISWTMWVSVNSFFWFRGILGSASGAEFPVSLSNHVGFTPRLLYSSTTYHSPESFTHLKIWLSSRCLTSVIVRELIFPPWFQPLTFCQLIFILILEYDLYIQYAKINIFLILSVVTCYGCFVIKCSS